MKGEITCPPGNRQGGNQLALCRG